MAEHADDDLAKHRTERRAPDLVQGAKGSRRFSWCVLLVAGKRKPARGRVLLRSVWVATLVYAISLGLREALLPDRSWTFEVERLRELVAESIPAYGVIFATVYALFYTRFASQWTYLAQQYNQMMAAGTRMDRTNPESTDCLHRWQAGFIEDADALHLALKPMFASTVREMLSDERVRKHYVECVPGGEAQARELEERIERSWAEADRKSRERSRSDVG
jgi:hypothetical protein